MPITPNNQGPREESLNGRLLARQTLEGSTMCRGSLYLNLGSPRNALNVDPVRLA
jgi:hypothetical protein